MKLNLIYKFPSFIHLGDESTERPAERETLLSRGKINETFFPIGALGQNFFHFINLETCLNSSSFVP